MRREAWRGGTKTWQAWRGLSQLDSMSRVHNKDTRYRADHAHTIKRWPPDSKARESLCPARPSVAQESRVAAALLLEVQHRRKG